MSSPAHDAYLVFLTLKREPVHHCSPFVDECGHLLDHVVFRPVDSFVTAEAPSDVVKADELRSENHIDRAPAVEGVLVFLLPRDYLTCCANRASTDVL